jgi:CheY-like chemotaxis protein
LNAGLEDSFDLDVVDEKWVVLKISGWHGHCVLIRVKFQTDQIPTTFASRNTFSRGVAGGLFADQYPMRTLMAEHDFMCRRVMGMFLKSLGYCPTIVENGKECLEEASRGCYDLILTDLEMPEMTGIECVGELRRLGLDVFIVAVTSCSLPNAREFCVEAGMDGYLPKPFDGSALKTVLREAYASIKEKYALLA